MTLTEGAAAHQPTAIVRDRFEGIEGLRGIAALSVLVHHTANYLSTAANVGQVGLLTTVLAHGLTLFFALSGFLLYKPFADAILGHRGFPSIRRYSGSRFLRIYPAYLAIFLVAAFALGVVWLDGAPGLGVGEVSGRMTDPVDILANVFVVQSYVPEALLTGIGPAWSLSAEIAFYVVMPVLAYGAYRIAGVTSKRVAVLLPAVVLIAVGLGTKAWIAAETSTLVGNDVSQWLWGHTWTAVVSRSLLAQADLFGYGMLVAVVLSLGGGRVRAHVATTTVLLVAGLVMLRVTTTHIASVYAPVAAGIASAFVIAAVAIPATTGTNWVAGVLRLRPFAYLGLISYSVYLWHVPVIWWLDEHDLVAGRGLAGFAVNVLVVSGVTIGLSSLTYRFIEKPALALKSRL
ncbi:acyltransferase [Nocardioides conyzicola]|uniref:Acyltransferase n=1 Tax=Nocardioides conyzicola TaxID=1651781 RepID=A0ABP8XUM4_9ACTN